MGKKFQPPSSRKVEVDVRLDDVVLRALEKDPERRYQHASQVKTAVDTIASSAAPPPSAGNAAALAQEILSRDYTLNIRSCVRRGWRLLKGEFWPLIGITALMLALFSFASSFTGISVQHGPAGHNSFEITSVVAMLVWGPLMGGLMFYFLKKIRREPATVETAFCGFGHRFLHLFLAGFVTSLLTWLGFLCLLLPGVYLLAAWMFTLPLVIDKRLDFWSAMELSRKVVTKHWFKFFGFGIVLMLLEFVGMLAFVVGVFLMSPLVLAALMYAYEDIFGQAALTVPPPLARTGPSGTIVMPMAPDKPPRTVTWTPAVKTALAVVALVIGVLVMMSLAHRRGPWNTFSVPQAGAIQSPVVATEPAPSASPAEPVENISHPVFGPAIERKLTNLTAVNLVSGLLESLPQTVTEQNRGPEKDSAASGWMENAGMDIAYVGEYDGFYGMTRDMTTLERNSWENYSPEQLAESLRDSGQDVGEKFGDSSRLNNPTNYTYGFKTREGSLGLLQITGFTDNPSVAMIRYKLVQPTAVDKTDLKTAMPAEARNFSQEALNERLEAASSMNDATERDKPLAAVAIDAAKAGVVDIVTKSLTQMNDQTIRDQTTYKATLLLAKRGLRKQAIEIAKGINDDHIRDQVLFELAQ